MVSNRFTGSKLLQQAFNVHSTLVRHRLSFEGKRTATHFPVQDLALTNDWQILRKHALLRIERQLAIGSSCPVKSPQKLPDRLLIFDALLDFT
jgi:hypothetical protein